MINKKNLDYVIDDMIETGYFPKLIRIDRDYYLSYLVKRKIDLMPGGVLYYRGAKLSIESMVMDGNCKTNFIVL